jgi:hypothetical protein
LRDAGVLTPEEFEAKKAELLKRILNDSGCRLLPALQCSV